MAKDEDDEEKEAIIIDITDYQKVREDEAIELDEFTKQFLNSINQTIVERQQSQIRSRFLYFMVNFLLLTQFISFIMIAIIMSKI